MCVNYTSFENKRVNEHAVTIILIKLIFLRHKQGWVNPYSN